MQKYWLQPSSHLQKKSGLGKQKLNIVNHYGTISDISSASSSSSRPANVHALNNIYFKDPTTPQKLEAALEIREGRDVMVEKLPDLVGDELPTTRVLLFPLIYETC